MRSFSKAGFVAVVLPCLTSFASAQINKCVVSGQVVYQQEACGRAGGTGEKLKVYPNGGDELGSSNPLAGSPPVKVDPVAMSIGEASTLFAERRSAIVAEIKDPQSAQFKEVAVVRTRHSSGEITYFCGKINAKNSYGGYTGFQLFVSEGQDIQIETKNFVSYRKLGNLWYNVQPIWTHCFSRGIQVSL